MARKVAGPWQVSFGHGLNQEWKVTGMPGACGAQDQFGVGIQLSPKWPWGYLLGGKEDFVFGIFGRSECAKGALEHQWARANAP